MKGIILLYQFQEKTPHALMNKFCKKFYGQDTSSHRGKYRYHLEGLLDRTPHHRLIRQVVILKQEDLKGVMAFLQQYPIIVHLREVVLTEEDRIRLGVQPVTRARHRQEER